MFAAIPPDVAFDIEVKMATPDDLAVTPAEEVNWKLHQLFGGLESCRAVQIGVRLLQCWTVEACSSTLRPTGVADANSTCNSAHYHTQVDRMVSATLAAVDAGLAAHGARLVMFSSFDPDVCVEIKRRCEPVRNCSAAAVLGPLLCSQLPHCWH